MRTLLLTTVTALMTQPNAAADLADLRWRHRLVVTASADAVAAQRAERSRDVGGWAERQLVLVELTTENAMIDGKPADLNVAAAREKLGLDRDTAVALVGLDGGVKQRRERAFTNNELFAAVDAMPMRRGS